jgi:hypothetical protein
VVSDELLEVVRVHDDVHACNLSTAELLWVVRLACGHDGLAAVSNVHVARGELALFEKEP